MRLSPTLWRTCRVLSGRTRLALLRRIINRSGQAVSQLAQAEEISVPRASQELRRLQSRGIVGVKRLGRFVLYVPAPDPLVYSAAPILRAMKLTFKRFPLSLDEEISLLAHGLSHPKRVAIVRALQQSSMPGAELQSHLEIPEQTLRHHYVFLARGGWVEKKNGVWCLIRGEHPLSKCFLKLL